MDSLGEITEDQSPPLADTVERASERTLWLPFTIWQIQSKLAQIPRLPEFIA